MTKNDFRNDLKTFLRDPGQCQAFIRESLIVSITEALYIRMTQLQLSQTKLAQRAGVPTRSVRRFFLGEGVTPELTIALLYALGCTAQITLQPLPG